MAKSTFKKEFKPTQHTGRRIPLHLTEKVERELKKLIDEKQIKKLTKCSDEHFISPVVITHQIRPINQNSTRLEKIKRRHTQKQISNAEHGSPNGQNRHENIRTKNTRKKIILQ